jgi:bacterioferritin (cytochrome b1)
MSITVDFWHLVGLLGAFLVFAAGAGKLLLDQSQRHLDERFSTQEKARAEQAEQLSTRLNGLEQVNRDETVQWQRVEREILQLKADLPLNYVRREDYVQALATIMARLDAINMRFENILLILGGKNHE